MDIIIDLETAPLIFDRTTKIDEETGEKKDIGALSPITGKITAIAWLVVGTGFEPFSVCSTDETALLTKFWQAITNTAQEHTLRFVGFNIKQFDMHFLLVRSLACNVKICSFSRRHLVDLREILTAGNTYMKKGTLGDYAQILQIPSKFQNLDGENATQLFKNGQLDMLKRYVEQDVIITYELYKRMEQLHMLSILW